MRNFLFELIGKACIVYAGFSDRLTDVLVWIFTNSLATVKLWVAHASMALLKMVDAKRVEAEQEQMANMRTRLELQLMQAAVRIKENAIEEEDWTDEHSEALNMVGMRLVMECNWSHPQVHKYFKPLVESFEGLEYGGA